MKGGEIMKKVFSIVFFVLAVTAFLYAMYVSVAGALDVNCQLAELAAREASGHELLGIGLDILVFWLALVSVFGLAIAIISWKIAQYRVVRMISGFLCPSFLLPLITCAFIIMM